VRKRRKTGCELDVSLPSFFPLLTSSLSHFIRPVVILQPIDVLVEGILVETCVTHRELVKRRTVL